MHVLPKAETNSTDILLWYKYSPLFLDPESSELALCWWWHGSWHVHYRSLLHLSTYNGYRYRDSSWNTTNTARLLHDTFGISTSTSEPIYCPNPVHGNQATPTAHHHWLHILFWLHILTPCSVLLHGNTNPYCHSYDSLPACPWYQILNLAYWLVEFGILIHLVSTILQPNRSNKNLQPP